MNMLTKVTSEVVEGNSLGAKFVHPSALAAGRDCRLAAHPACRGRHLLEQRSLPSCCSNCPYGDGRGTHRARTSTSGTIMSAVSKRAGASRYGRAFRARSSPSTSPTARSSVRDNCSSPSIPARSPPRWPRPAPASPRRRANWRWPKQISAERRRLFGNRGGLTSNVDQLIAKARSARAALAAAQARVQARALDVEFTQVRAPIGGRISDRRIDAGQPG